MAFTVPFFAAERGTRAAVIGETALPKLMALRALAAGARVHVVAAQPADWLRLRSLAGTSAEGMTVVHPGTPLPADGTRTTPRVIIDDSGAASFPAQPALTLAAQRPWQAVLAVLSRHLVTIPALRGLDAIALHRSTPACRAAVVGALSLPAPVVRSLHGIPRDVVAIASAGTVMLVPLTPAELELPIWRSNDEYPIGPGLSRTVSFETNGTCLEGEVA